MLADMNAQRGQAVLETMLFLPMFLLALFGMIWAVQAGVQYERAESAVRYAGLISQQANPYADYSFYAMYTQLGSTTIPTVACVVPLTDPLSDAAPTYNSAHTTTASSPFWTPTGGTSPGPGCSAPNPASIVGIQAGTGLTQDLLLTQQNPYVSSSVNVPPALRSALGSLSSTQANERFFRPVGIEIVLGCYATLNTQINASLNYTTDTSSPNTAPPQLSSTITPITPAAAASCLTW
jgi:hypothetical protein